MIIETVVTTLNPDGSVNCGAMGVEWGEREIVIKPYRGTRTLRNLREHGVAKLCECDRSDAQEAVADDEPERYDDG